MAHGCAAGENFGDPSQDYFASAIQLDPLWPGQRIIVTALLGDLQGVQSCRDCSCGANGRGGEEASRSGKSFDPPSDPVPTDAHIWAQSYDEDLRDTLSLQGKVARDIAEQIRVTLNRQEQAALAKSKTVNPEAYEAYLKGRYFWNKRTGDGLKKAIEYFSRAIETDPTYAEAYSGLADSYALSGDWEYGVLSPRDAFSQARAAATKALALNDRLGEDHTSLAFEFDL
jgi:tetratricopeptide (TPR) repeat protein